MPAGSVLAGKYRLESLLEQGGMGSVWRAEHLGFKAPVAVKLMDPARAQTAEGLARFHREAHAAALIRSSHVVQVLDHGLDEATDTPFIVMELLEGETLGKRLRRERCLSLATTARIVADVCQALVRAHQAGIVHRDLKPENIFLVNDGREFAKVLDFGVARAEAFAVGFGENTRTGDVVGTPCYMSPEQIRGDKDLDSRSDLWSLAVIACECVTGRRPFTGNTMGSLVISICTEPIPAARSLGPSSPEFETWLERGLQRDPAQRFQTASELSESLLALGSNGAALAVPPAAQPEPAPASPLSNTFGAQTASVIPKRLSLELGLAAVGALAVFAMASWFLREPSRDIAVPPPEARAVVVANLPAVEAQLVEATAPPPELAREQPIPAKAMPRTDTASSNRRARASSEATVAARASAGGTANPDPAKPEAPVAPRPVKSRAKLINALAGDR